MSYSNKSRKSYGNEKPDNTAVVASNAERVTQHMLKLEKAFNDSAVNSPHISFKRESVFAKHVIQNSDYLTHIAICNPMSFETAFLQLASSGLTLDPSQKLAYLVPRDGRVILDVSYLGLMRMATDEGLCLDVVAELVFENDKTFINNGRRNSPTHEFDPFADKGDLVLTNYDKGNVGARGHLRGIYIDYLMKDQRHLVYFSTVADLAAARSASDSWRKTEKRTYSPWTRFPWKMALKSAIKQTIFQIPGNRTRLSAVIDYLNVYGEEGFKPSTHIPVQAAEYEMNLRQGSTPSSDSSSSSSTNTGNSVIEGEFVQQAESNNVSPTVQPEQTDKPVQKGCDSLNDSSPAEQVYDMSDIPGVRTFALKRTKKLVQRANATFAYESILSTVSENFGFNQDEVKHAVQSLIIARREVLQNRMIFAVENFDFKGVDDFISLLADGEFKDKTSEWVNSVKEEMSELRCIYDEGIKTGDFSSVELAIQSVTFAPLQSFLSSLIVKAKAEIAA